MTPDEFLRQVAQAITRQEDLNDRETRDILYELALRIYALLLSRLPATNFERQLRWPQLRSAILPQLQGASDAIATQLFARVDATNAEVAPIVAEYSGLASAALPPPPLQEAAARTRVLATPLPELFTASPVTGISPFALQLLRLLERSLLPAFFKEESSRDVAAHVIGTRTIAGRSAGVATRGTVASAWRERLRAITAAALWAQLTPLQEQALQQSGTVSTQWEWVAILDPKTCPICRPLDGQVAAAPQFFPRGAPPLHPKCRCVVIPRLAT